MLFASGGWFVSVFSSSTPVPSVTFGWRFNDDPMGICWYRRPFSTSKNLFSFFQLFLLFCWFLLCQVFLCIEFFPSSFHDVRPHQFEEKFLFFCQLITSNSRSFIIGMFPCWTSISSLLISLFAVVCVVSSFV
jgi:hypothetical protein